MVIMGDAFTYSVLDVVVGQLCLQVGFDKCSRTALRVTTDVLHHYIRNLLIRIGSYTEVASRTEPTVQDVLLAFKDFRIGIADLQKYIKEFGEIPPAVQVPKFPIPRENHLNFLRPGSHELIVRPLHIHEHLPAMYPELETDPTGFNMNKFKQISNNLDKTENRETNELSTKGEKCKTSESVEECSVGSPLRELESVIMTSGGFISSSYAGVLPEAVLPNEEYDVPDNSGLVSLNSSDIPEEINSVVTEDCAACEPNKVEECQPEKVLESNNCIEKRSTKRKRKKLVETISTKLQKEDEKHEPSEKKKRVKTKSSDKKVRSTKTKRSKKQKPVTTSGEVDRNKQIWLKRIMMNKLSK